jgi:hypothetical protein
MIVLVSELIRGFREYRIERLQVESLLCHKWAVELLIGCRHIHRPNYVWLEETHADYKFQNDF